MALRLSAHMTVMANAAQKAAKRLLRDFNEVEQLQVSIKGPSDFVSQADLRAEAILKEELTKARPGYAFLMEESGASGSDNWAWRWVVDPLDGTTNFLHGMPHWAISIGLERRLPDGSSELTAGLVYAPATDELFWAEKGAGAFLNERRLRVSARRELKDAVFATGIPFAAVAPQRRLAFARTLGALMPQVAGIRRFGAAALEQQPLLRITPKTGPDGRPVAAEMNIALQFKPPHISIYHLTIEPNTVFAKFPPVIPEDDDAYAMLDRITETFGAQGKRQSLRDKLGLAPKDNAP